MKIGQVNFPKYSGIRCLMMPYIQGDFSSVPNRFYPYKDIINSLFIKQGDLGFLTIDESNVQAGQAHRGARAKFGRALHTEAGKIPMQPYGWGNAWGGSHNVIVDEDVQVLLANSIDCSCAVWDAMHENTSVDGDIGNFSDQYPYEDAQMMNAGDVFQIGILTPHESLPVKNTQRRQFLRIVSSGVHGREEYFTQNPLVEL